MSFNFEDAATRSCSYCTFACLSTNRVKKYAYIGNLDLFGHVTSFVCTQKLNASKTKKGKKGWRCTSSAHILSSFIVSYHRHLFSFDFTNAVQFLFFATK